MKTIKELSKETIKELSKNTIKELSKEQKLEIIEEILCDWKRLDGDCFICCAIVNAFIFRGWVNDRLCRTTSYSAMILIPELEQIRPGVTGNWFGAFARYGGIRTQKLLELKGIIEAS
jgi:hypothetical protein